MFFSIPSHLYYFFFFGPGIIYPVAQTSPPCEKTNIEKYYSRLRIRFIFWKTKTGRRPQAAAGDMIQYHLSNIFYQN